MKTVPAKLGLVSLGQTPREDVVTAMRKVLGPDVFLIEKGVLDNIDLMEMASLTPEPGDAFPLISRLRDGSQCVLSKHALIPRLERCFQELQEEGVSIAILLCTCVFEGLKLPENMLVLEAGPIVDGWIMALASPKSRLGIMVPLPEQALGMVERYREFPFFDCITASASPYGPKSAIREAAQRLAQADCIILHCMGYTAEHKQLVQESCGRPVLYATGVLAHTAAALFS